MNIKDSRQRFFVDDSPIRGDVVSIEKSLADILSHRNYPDVLKVLLGEMLVSACLLASTLKIQGRLSIQLQSSADTSLISWAMAECNHLGELRALAKVNDHADWSHVTATSDIFDALNKANQHSGVLFLNIEPDQGQSYQSIVALVSNHLTDCIVHYQNQSAQIPTLLKVACNGSVAGGILVQQLPTQNEAEAQKLDTDQWPRLSSLTQTLTADELVNLPAKEILYRLYHEENIRLPEPMDLSFACTCSLDKCLAAIKQVGIAEVTSIFAEQNQLDMDCQFCGHVYHIDKATAMGLFEPKNAVELPN